MELKQQALLAALSRADDGNDEVFLFLKIKIILNSFSVIQTFLMKLQQMEVFLLLNDQLLQEQVRNVQKKMDSLC